MTRHERSEWHKGKCHIDSNRIVERVAGELDAATTGLDLIDWPGVDGAALAPLVRDLDNAMVVLRRFQRDVHAVTDPVILTDRPPCQHCGRPVRPSETGRKVLYCSRSCRQRAYEARQDA